MKKKGSEQEGKLTPEEQLQERPTDFLIVGIGASAGGITALQEFFKHVPEDSGMAYVVILHLSPDHDSQLASVLQRETSTPVAQVRERTLIKPNHIYVVPPDRHLTMEDAYIAVSPNLYIEERRAPVDIFFRTLADQHGPRAISVVLSGTGANGSMGLKRIKERGGATFVQNPREAEFSEMPRNAIATELVDEVLNVRDIPAKIIAYNASIGRVQIAEEAEQRSEVQQHALREVFTLLRQRTGHDFSNYKRPTLLRRIERRINVRGLSDLPAYSKFLQENQEEPTALLKDLLISVTNFFRDKKAFEMVEQEIIPLLLKDKKSEDHVRIWVAGCATGEEAYSLAMLCLEKTDGLIDAPKLQVFATDIDEAAITHGREGFYTINDLADVSPERLRRFFNKEGDGYRVRREMREIVMFAFHNFLKDPPFSHLDLVSCRNVMIYLNHVAQERVIETFHFALNPGSYLFLGNSESIDGATDLYATFNRDYHIFQSRQVGPRAYPLPDSLPALYKPKADYEQPQTGKTSERISFGDLHQQLLEEYAPPSIVVNENYDIVHLTQKSGAYLQITGGELSQNLLRLVKPELRLELRSALYQATQRQSPVATKGVKLTINDRPETINIHVRPVLKAGNTARGFILVLFEPSTEEGRQEVLQASDEPVARQLEEELSGIKLQLRASNEQHDFQAEELKASNEELQAMNEELRSAAEELETSKEELQSMNEELRTVNQELKVKIEETSIAGNNLQNLINSTNIGTIFLDRSFRVVLFTPASKEIFNLRSSDYGRPLSDITGSLEYDHLVSDAQNVLEKLVEFETEVPTKNGSLYLMRITPYRTDEDRIKGVVITFLDITHRKKADEALRISEEKYRRLFNSIDEGFCIVEVLFNEADKPFDYRIIEANNAFEKQTGLVNVIGKTMKDMVSDHEQHWFDIYGRVVKTGIPERFENEARTMGRFYEVYAFSTGKPGENQVAVIFNDITDRKRREANLTFLAAVSEDLVKLTNVEETMNRLGEKLAAHFDLSLCVFVEVDETAETGTVNYGWHRADVPKISGTYRIGDLMKPEFQQASRAGETIVIPNLVADPLTDTEKFAALKSGSFLIVPLLRGGEWQFWLGFYRSEPSNWHDDEIELLRELTNRIWIRVERARAEEALAESEEKYHTLFDSIDQGFYIAEAIYDAAGKLIDYRHLEVNPAFERKSGLKNVIGKLASEIAPNLESYWLDPIDHVVQTGEPTRIENYDKNTGRWYRVYYSPVGGAGSRLIGAVFDDITERKNEEERKEFLLKLSDVLGELIEPIEIQTTACRILGEHVKISRVLYGEVIDEKLVIISNNYVNGVPQIVASLNTEQFGEDLIAAYKRNEKVIFSNVNTDSRFTEKDRENFASINVVASASMGLLKGGRWVAAFGMHHNAPKEWTTIEISLMEEVAERTWAAVEKAKVEKALRGSEQRLQRMVNVEGVGVLTFDYAGRMLTANDAFLKIVGYSRREFESRALGWQDFTPPEYVEASLHQMETITNAGLAGPYEKEYFRKDGSRTWLMFVAADLGDGTIVEYAVDVANRKQAEEALRKSEERLQLATRAAKMGTFVYYPNEDRGEPDDRMLSLFGLPLGSKLNLSEAITNIVHPDDRERYVNEVALAVDPAGNGKLDSDIRIMHPEGSISWINITAQTSFSGNQPYAAKMSGVAMDITERKKAEEALQQSRERLHLIIESAKGFAIFTTTAEGAINSWSGGAAEIFGWSEADINGQSGDVLFTPEDRAVNQPQVERETAVSNGVAPDIRWHLCKDGSLVFINGFAHPLYDTSGKLNGFVKIGRDITAQYNAEIALRTSEEKYRTRLEKEVEQQTVALKDINTDLRYANENLQQFASIASHDLQEPLRKLRLFVSILKRYNEIMPEEAKEILEKIWITSDRMSKLIKEVLQYAKISSGAREFTKTDLNLILQNVLSDLDLLIEETGTIIQRGEPLPEVEAVPLQMNQLFYNLLINALKYRHKDIQGVINISFSTLTPDMVSNFPELKTNKSYIEIVVTDNGIGFDEQYAEQIFQIFARLHGTDEYDGTGVGLALCKKIVENHSGHIYARSTEGQGTSFHVLLPTHH